HIRDQDAAIGATLRGDAAGARHTAPHKVGGDCGEIIVRQPLAFAPPGAVPRFSRFVRGVRSSYRLPYPTPPAAIDTCERERNLRIPLARSLARRGDLRHEIICVARET